MSRAELTVDIPITERDNTNEELVNTPVSSQNGEERVLMERDGKFELIKVHEIEATVEPIAEKDTEHTGQLCKPSPISPQSKMIEVPKTALKENKKILRTPNRTDSRMVAPTSSQSSRHSLSVQALSAVNSTSRVTQSKRPRPNTQPPTPVDSPSKTQVRPLTAPLGYIESYSLYSVQDLARRELAQEAFRAWLDMKDRQLIEGSKNRTDRARDNNSPDTDKKKSEAYQAWMESKRKQVLTEISARNKKQSINFRENQRKPENKTTFDKWLKKKSNFGTSKKNISTIALTSFRQIK